MSIKHIPIIGKILLILGVFGLLSIASTLFTTTKMRHIGERYSNAIDQQGKSAIALSRANSALKSVRVSIAELELVNSEDAKKRALGGLAEAKAEFIAWMDKATLADPTQTPKFQDLKARGLKIIEKTCADAVDLGHDVSGQADLMIAQGEFLNNCAPALQTIVPAMSKAVDESMDSQDRVEAEMSDLTDMSIKITYAVVLGALAVVVLGAFLAVRSWVSRPIKTLTTTMNRLAGGDLETPIIGLERRDELGPMAKAVQIFKDNGIQLRQSQVESQQLRTSADQSREQTEAEREAAAALQAKVVAGLATGLERLSAGDLQYRIEAAFSQEYEKLRGDFNNAMSRLDEAMTVVSDNTSAIRSGSNEISSASDDLSRRTEQQAASLEQTSAALDEITATVKKTSEGSTQARTLVANAKADAEQSGEVVGRAVQAMSAIQKSAHQVNQIISVIDEIAFQTNLLALNAGVEAARAGESGRGFAVVASEVRSLAQRSADAAREIKTLIAASSRSVEEGVDLVGQTVTALGRIAAQVSDINTVVSEIAASTQEQASALQEVNTAINHMDQVTQQNAAMVEQSTAASRSLARDADELSVLVGRFSVSKLGQSAPAAAPAKTPKRADKSFSAPALKTVGARGGAARQAAPEPTWHEF